MSPALLVYNAIHRESAHSAVNARGFWPLLSDSRGYCLPAYFHSTVRRAIFTMSFGGSKANPLYESDDEGDPVVDALYDLMDTDGDGKLHGRGSLQACFSPPRLLTWTTTRDQVTNYLPHPTPFLSPAPLYPFAHAHTRAAARLPAILRRRSVPLLNPLPAGSLI